VGGRGPACGWCPAAHRAAAGQAARQGRYGLARRRDLRVLGAWPAPATCTGPSTATATRWTPCRASAGTWVPPGGSSRRPSRGAGHGPEQVTTDGHACPDTTYTKLGRSPRSHGRYRPGVRLRSDRAPLPAHHRGETVATCVRGRGRTRPCDRVDDLDRVADPCRGAALGRGIRHVRRAPVSAARAPSAYIRRDRGPGLCADSRSEVRVRWGQDAGRPRGAGARERPADP